MTHAKDTVAMLAEALATTYGPSIANAVGSLFFGFEEKIIVKLEIGIIQFAIFWLGFIQVFFIKIFCFGFRKCRNALF